MNELLLALNKFKDVSLISPYFDTDTDSRILFNMVNKFCDTHPLARVYTSLGQLRYLSCMKYVDGVISNSSSGITNAVFVLAL